MFFFLAFIRFTTGLPHLLDILDFVEIKDGGMKINLNQPINTPVKRWHNSGMYITTIDDVYFVNFQLHMILAY